VGVAPEEAAEKVEASGKMHDVPGAKRAIGGGMEFGGRNRGLGASGVPTEPILASTTTAVQVFVGGSSLFAIQTAAATKGYGAVQACGGGLKAAILAMVALPGQMS
jgi:hypothetical protein